MVGTQKCFDHRGFISGIIVTENLVRPELGLGGHSSPTVEVAGNNSSYVGTVAYEIQGVIVGVLGAGIGVTAVSNKIVASNHFKARAKPPTKLWD